MPSPSSDDAADAPIRSAYRYGVNDLAGDMAAPPVRDVIKAHFDKKARRDPRQQLAGLPSFGPARVAENRPPAQPEVAEWR